MLSRDSTPSLPPYNPDPERDIIYDWFNSQGLVDVSWEKVREK